MNVTASEVFATSAVLTWEAPKSDGGSPVTGYLIDRATNNSGRWIRVTRDEVKDLTLSFDSLMEGTVYEFRVYAVNKKGESQPSEPCEPFTAKNPYGKATCVIIICPLQLLSWFDLFDNFFILMCVQSSNTSYPTAKSIKATFDTSITSCVPISINRCSW